MHGRNSRIKNRLRKVNEGEKERWRMGNVEDVGADMRVVGTAVVSEEGVEVLFRNGAVIISGAR